MSYKVEILGMVAHMHVIPALGSLRKYEFEARLGYLVTQ
jgi:hypothetical protein